MTYDFPDGMTYTEMAIWIDEHVYQDNLDEGLLYQYLYHLSHMLAGQHSLFRTAQEYDQFSLYSASRLFQRLMNVKQYEYDESNKPKMNQIKSILNYIKKILYPYKVDFEVEIKSETKDIDIIPTGTFDLGSHMVESASLFDKIEFSLALDSIAQIVKSRLRRIPIRKNSSEWDNIYLSCMLTLLDSVTLSRQTLARYESAQRINKDAFLDQAYQDMRYKDPILYHLPDSMANYIRVLVNELRHVIAAELSWKSECYIPSDASMKSLICTTMESK